MIYLGNDLVYTLGTPDPLTDTVTGLVVTDAVVTAQLLNGSTRAVITGTTATLSHVSGGMYRGVITSAALTTSGIVAGQRVIRAYTAVAGGATGRWEEYDAVDRRSS
jgi:hypothetical protein